MHVKVVGTVMFPYDDFVELVVHILWILGGWRLGKLLLDW